MASFKTHLTCGVALGIASVSLANFFHWVDSDWSYFILLALMVVVGSVLPDMDSDTGIPFNVTFGSLSLTAGGLGLVFALKNFPGDYRWIAGLPLAAMFVMWVVIGSIFKKLTRHRGIIHSIPALALSGLVVFYLATFAGFDEWKAFLLGLATALGYFLHLVLDEMYAAVNFHGIPFIPNKALGSALKLKSQNFGVNALVYGLLLLFTLNNGPALLRLFGRLSGTLK